MYIIAYVTYNITLVLNMYQIEMNGVIYIEKIEIIIHSVSTFWNELQQSRKACNKSVLLYQKQNLKIVMDSWKNHSFVESLLLLPNRPTLSKLIILPSTLCLLEVIIVLKSGVFKNALLRLLLFEFIFALPGEGVKKLT